MDGPGAPERIEIELTPHAPIRDRSRSASSTDGAEAGHPEDRTHDGADAGHSPSAWLGTDRGRLVATSVGVGLLGLVLGWALGRTGDPGTVAPATETSPPTTIERFPTAGPFASVETLPEAEVDAAPRTTRPRPTSTLPPVPVVRPIELDPRLAGMPMRLVGIRFDNRLVELDLATGRATERQIPASSSFEPGLMKAGDDWILLPRNDSTDMRLIRDDGTETDFPAGDQWSLLPVVGTDEFWRTGNQRGFEDTLQYEKVNIDGDVLGPVIEMPWRSWAIAADPFGGVVTTYNGKVYRVTETGATQLAVGELLGISAGVVVVRDCDEVLRCGLSVVDRATGEIAIVPPDPDFGPDARYESLIGWGASRRSPLSPDDRSMVVAAYGDVEVRLGIVDLESGVVTSLSDPYLTDVIEWSPDGRFLFVIVDGVVSAVDRETGETFPVVDDEPTWRGFTARRVSPASAEETVER